MYQFLEQTVDRYMTRKVKTVSREVTMDELNGLFASDDFNAYPVVDQSEVVGLVTKFDFLKCFALTVSSMVPRYDELMKRTVSDVMIHDFIYVNATTKLVRVLQLMVEHRLRSIPVMDTGQHLVGIIAREDVMRALRDCTRGEQRAV
ncbi:CBS domain containing membrane protein [Nitrobacter hamburgensis X14]|uniref:CBS domain containing membrane protein n=1 Tax=Nitrobacter hamburgensis (strain DSM 10229 / NCIMB 13809 / X14) TaxID=323097 RepID=Q1QM21_NITHX|nr:CBS domain-containing protein [Nitrobacter hamburgensis]ABE62726.1 CBS domain containing membrane protein [Nitrobacter hamburgensis X14]